MSKVSNEFGQLIKKILEENNLTLRAAGFKSGISAAYWKDMSDGRVPSEEIIERIAAALPEANENELRTAAGYAPRTAELDPVQAVEFALRGQKSIPDEGKLQILDFVKRMQKKYSQENS